MSIKVLPIAHHTGIANSTLRVLQIVELEFAKVVIELNELAAIHSRKALCKRHRVLLWLSIASEHYASVTRFDAEHIGDHVLNTTVANIQAQDGLKIYRMRTMRPTRFSRQTKCTEYWLSLSEVKKARKIILKAVHK